MNIGLDYDGTFDQDPELWIRFIDLAESRGHKIFFVSMRTNPLAMTLLPANAEVVLTAGRAKQDFCQASDISIDIWIDDQPEKILYHATGG